MAHFIPFSLQILHVADSGFDFNRNPLNDVDAVSLKADHLFRVVGYQADLFRTQKNENLGADPVIAQVVLETEFNVGFHGVLALVLKCVGAQLVGQTYAAAFLAHVKDDALPFGLNHFHGMLELVAAVTAAAPENITGQAFGMHPDEDWIITLNLALDEGKVFQLIDGVVKGYGLEITEPGGEHDLGCFLDQGLMLHPVSDQVGNGADFQTMFPGVIFSVAACGP